MFTKLVVVNGVHDDAGEPSGLRPTFGHGSLRELSEGVAILLGGLRGYLQCAFGVGAVGRQQDSALGFHRQDAIAGLQAKPVGHVLWQGGADGSTRLAKSHLFGHASKRSILVLHLVLAGSAPLLPSEVMKKAEE